MFFSSSPFSRSVGESFGPVGGLRGGRMRIPIGGGASSAGGGGSPSADADSAVSKRQLPKAVPRKEGCFLTATSPVGTGGAAPKARLVNDLAPRDGMRRCFIDRGVATECVTWPGAALAGTGQHFDRAAAAAADSRFGGVAGGVAGGVEPDWVAGSGAGYRLGVVVFCLATTASNDGGTAPGPRIEVEADASTKPSCTRAAE